MSSNVQISILFMFLLCRCISSQSSDGSVLSADAQEYVNAHNQIRVQRGLPPVTWDSKLADFAHYWASQRADDCNPFVHSTGDYGENIMWELYNEDTPTTITQGWAAEEKNFDLQWHKCRCQPETATCMCGHYIQLIWRTSIRIGCGNYTCNNQKGTIIVCSYDPPGNYVGEDPYWPLDCGIPSPPPPVTYTPPPVTTTTQPLPIMIPAHQAPFIPSQNGQQLLQAAAPFVSSQNGQAPISFTSMNGQQMHQVPVPPSQKAPHRRRVRRGRRHRRNKRRNSAPEN